MRPDSNPAAIQASDSAAMRGGPVRLPWLGNAAHDRESHWNGNNWLGEQCRFAIPNRCGIASGECDLGQAQQPQQHSIFDLFPSLSGH